MSAPWLALMSSSTGRPCTAVTVTDAGLEPSAGQHLVGFRLGRLLGLPGDGGVLRVVGGLPYTSRTAWWTVSTVSGRAVGHRFGRGPFQGPAGMTGAVDSDNNASHVYLL